MPRGPLLSRNFRLLLACNVISVTGTAIAAAGGILIIVLTVAVLLIPEVRNMRRHTPVRPGRADPRTP
jgi:hypothetical protein